MTQVQTRSTLGESFVLIHDIDGDLTMDAALVRKVGRGHMSVIRVVRSNATREGSEAVSADPPAPWFFDYWLPDGRQGRLSGNGLRVYAQYLLEAGLVTLADRRDTIAIGTRAGVCDALTGVSGIAVDLGRWRLVAADASMVRVSIGGVSVMVSRVGEVMHDDDLLVVVPDHTPEAVGGVGHAQARVWKPAQAPSSGLGAAAAAIALRHWWGIVIHHWSVTMPGGSCGVRMFPTEEGEHLSVSGP